MASVDGLIKNETVSMVRDRYYIKVEGDNAPMNIAPTFKLGMNVKFMSHFSTTTDAVIFPEQMKNICRTEMIDGKEYMKLEDVLINAGLYNNDNELYCAFNEDWSDSTDEILGVDPDKLWIDVAEKEFSPIINDDTVVAIPADEIGEYRLSTEKSGNTLLKGDVKVMDNFAGIKHVPRTYILSGG
jgi:hypothetical protein